jgi:tripartite motif-containing protein 37
MVLEISSVERFSGSLWRLKAYIFQSKKTDSLYLSLFVELFQGLPGEFEYKFQLKEPSHEFSASLTKTYKSHFKEGECWGYQKFIKLDNLFNSLYYDDLNDSISLVYSIRPTTFYQKCINLQNYIVEMEHKIMNSSENNTTGINENHVESARLLEAIPIRSRESEITLADESANYSIVLQQIQEIELVENTELESASPSSSVYESSTEAANTILSRLISTKLENNPSVSDSHEE